MRHQLILGHGMISDDTEHAVMSVQALMVSGGESEVFARDLSWRLRFWLLRGPAGIGFATLRSILKLWIGFDPASSGMFSVARRYAAI